MGRADQEREEGRKNKKTVTPLGCQGKANAETTNTTPEHREGTPRDNGSSNERRDVELQSPSKPTKEQGRWKPCRRAESSPRNKGNPEEGGRMKMRDRKIGPRLRKEEAQRKLVTSCKQKGDKRNFIIYLFLYVR
ncbi:hypothetical protein ACROYT_G004165 [Oculina patagonica]